MSTSFGCIASIDDPALVTQALALLRDEFGELPDGGIAAGQAVASAIFHLLGKHEGVFNDLDIFFRKTDDVNRIINAQWEAKLRGVELLDIKFGYRTTELCSPVFDKDGYCILGASYWGRFNLVIVEPLGAQNGEPFDGNSIIAGFDINACEAAIDLNTQTLFMSPAFRDFATHWVLDVTTYFTPAHTALRLARKADALDARINDTAIFRLQTVIGTLEHMQEARGLDYTKGLLMAEDNADKARRHPLIQKHFTFREISIYIDDEDSNMKLMQLSPRRFHQPVVDAFEQIFQFTGNKAKNTMYGLFKMVWDRVAVRCDTSAIDWLIQTASDMDCMVSDYFFDGFSSEEQQDEIERRIAQRGVLIQLLIGALRDHHNGVFVQRQTCIRRACKMLSKHPRIMDELMSKKLSFEDILVTGKNLNWLEKKRRYHIIGLYEGYSGTALLPSLRRSDFTIAIRPFIERIEETMSQNRVTPIGGSLAVHLAQVSGGEVRELNSELALVNQGAHQRHCVGGYYQRVKAGTHVIFDLQVDSDKHYTLSYLVLTREDEVAYKKSEWRGRNNCSLPSSLAEKLPDFFTESDYNYEWFHESESRLQFDDDVPF